MFCAATSSITSPTSSPAPRVDVGLFAAGRDDRQRPAVRNRSTTGRRSSGTATPSAGTRCRRPSRWPTSTSSNAGPNDHVKTMAPAFRTTSKAALRAADRRRHPRRGLFYGIELVKDRAARGRSTTTSPNGCWRIPTTALWEAGLYCRADDRGDPDGATWLPADQRAEGVRRDLRHPAPGARRSQPAVVALSSRVCSHMWTVPSRYTWLHSRTMVEPHLQH